MIAVLLIAELRLNPDLVSCNRNTIRTQVRLQSIGIILIVISQPSIQLTPLTGMWALINPTAHIAANYYLLSFLGVHNGSKGRDNGSQQRENGSKE